MSKRKYRLKRTSFIGCRNTALMVSLGTTISIMSAWLLATVSWATVNSTAANASEPTATAAHAPQSQESWRRRFSGVF